MKTEIKLQKVKKSNQHEVIPLGKNKILAIILKQSKNTVWRWVNRDVDRFRVDGNTYFNDSSGIYLSTNNILVCVYLEGVALPIHHGQLTVNEQLKSYKDPLSGKEEFIKINTINNLKFDTRVIDMLLNRGLSDEFTKTTIDSKGIATLLLLVGIFVLTIFNTAGAFL